MARPPQSEGGRRAEWLETGSGRPGRRIRWLLGVGASLVLVVVVVVVSPRSLTSVPPPQVPTSSPTTSGSPSATRLPRPVETEPPPTSKEPAQTRLGHPLLDTAAGWQIIGYSARGIVRIDPAEGTIISTPVPAIPTDVPVVITTAAHYAVVRPFDDETGYLVADGRAAAPLAGVFRSARTILPSADPRYVWAMTDTEDVSGQTVRVRQVGIDGRSTGEELAIPTGGGYDITADGTGRVIINGLGGSYLAAPGRLAKLTSGQLVAVGPTRLLANECDDTATCRAVVIDRRDGAGRRVYDAPLPVSGGEMGVISPDGRWAMTTVARDDGVSDVVLTDLDLGDQRTLDVRVNGLGLQDHAWSPDSRWLLLTDQTRLYAVDPSTGTARTLTEVSRSLGSIVIRANG